jgi:hypothetical protein
MSNFVPLEMSQGEVAERVTLNEVLEHFDLLGAGKVLCHGEIPFSGALARMQY